MRKSTPQQVIPRSGTVERTLLYSFRTDIALVEFAASPDKKLYVLGHRLRDGERLDLRDPRVIDWSTKLDNARKQFNARAEA